MASRTEYSTICRGEIAVVRTPDSELVLWLDRVAGVVSLSGTVTSHLALLAAEADIPYLVLGDVAMSLTTGQRMMLDPVGGELWYSPL
ncbi:PEP-utilizing enzyme [Kibdelosporangium lantanae]|uniref:PEP-utilizing enzyme n=1 Tax=Kibdelosporangium lantanae TaxID=1497396 RepID=A0ABW3M1H3_9PSEU